MNIQDQFNLIAKEYDENRRKFIPCFDDYYVSATDFAEEMLSVAKKRFENVPNVKYEISDYSKKLPEGTPDLVLSALSIHHLEHGQKKVLFKMIHDSLSDDGKVRKMKKNSWGAVKKGLAGLKNCLFCDTFSV